MSNRLTVRLKGATFGSGHRHGGFTLIELLAVLAIVALLAVLSLPALSYLNGRQFESGVRQIDALLNLARQAAQTQNTYTWVLFYSSTDSQQSPQLTVVAISSKDGTDPITWGAYANIIPDSIIELIARPLTVAQIQLRDAGTLDSAVSSLPSPVGTGSNSLNSTVEIPMNLPSLGTVEFQKAVRFTPTGSAGNNDSSAKFIEIDLQPIRGSVADSKNVAVVRIDKASGNLHIFRP